jgi:predicted transcriptional regulator
MRTRTKGNYYILAYLKWFIRSGFVKDSQRRSEVEVIEKGINIAKDDIHGR